MTIDDLENYTVTGSSQDISKVETLTPIKSKTSATQKLLNAGTSVANFVGAKGISEQYGASMARVRLPQEQEGFVENPSLKQVAGSAIQTGALFTPGGAARGIAKKVALGAGTGYALDVGSKMQGDKSVGDIAKPGLGTLLGGALPIAGAGINKAKQAIPATLSFTSGVPQKAIEKAMQSPEAVKMGRVGTNVEEITKKSSDALKGLYTNLSDDFEKGLKGITSKGGQTKGGMTYNEKGFVKGSNQIRERLVRSTREFAREFNISMKKSPTGIEVDFSKSPIVKGGEKANIQEAMNTVSGWKDWSAKGTQDLAERIGALRNFESGARTESSAILGKMYNRLTSNSGSKKGIIGEFYPELAKLRSGYAKNRSALDDINDVLTKGKDNPRATQAAVTRLSNLFKEDKETYLNLIKELSDRSGTDILGLLAGTEFQRVLPNFIRGLGGGSALAVGSAVLNPWMTLLAPLFSPRAVGKGVELGVKSAPLRKAISETTKKVVPLVGTKLNQ